ncbi:hypothetical protein EDF46_3592 [Frondihabitans sp. PhB188]|nr:hypothetical protein EDF46_3592 [Frondihabitans sp. PhB188]
MAHVMTNQYGEAGPSLPSPLTRVPRSVVLAFWLFLASAALHLGVLVISIASYGTDLLAAKKQVGRITQGVGTSQAQSFAGAGLLAGIAITALIFITFVLISFPMRRGKNWARIVLLVVAVFSLSGVGSYNGVGALAVAAAITAVVLTFLPQSKPFFAVKN